ncbi:MAG: hypothetical protein OQJ83_05070 [Altibacter sp.]|uniref:hypothetical protein n=1 Tax=Altibacter lentus TaxID=1223410 RepID=UPI001268029F|nr:hypothetical protein [Altibacter lentus]MCW8980738.1 hypothetical protein [Altibacter sp.]
MYKITPLVLFLLAFMNSFSQEKPITILEEQKGNRLFLYAINENLKDYDVLLTVEGTGFRQPKGKPRLVRVPATSKVNVKSLIIERGETPKYTYTIEANDSLSVRVLKPEHELIKIAPKKHITIYITDQCTTCDAIVSGLDASVYEYRKLVLSEVPEMEAQLSKAFVGASTTLDAMTNPVVSLDNKLYINVETYEQLMEHVNE